ncbi:MAG: 1,4-alpha-glucan branching enzyme [Pseudoalteromonas tetraodonis]|jgi:1,4-alpha-glucan branching enzyme
MASTAGKKRVTFAVAAEPGSEVAVAGTFNNWQPMKLDREKVDNTGSKYIKRIFLGAGRYEYKFLIDGSWSIDPKCPSWSPNEYGSLNSVVEVK